MLLYSTILKIRDTLTKDAFIELVIRWNQESLHAENIIPNIDWNGERNKRYGDDRLWLDIEEYRNRNIIAVRYEKKQKDGTVWDTDFIMNFDEMKMAIQLDRTYTEDALMHGPAFSTPHFLTLLIDGGYLLDDGDLPVLKRPVMITEENVSLLASVINDEKKYKLPVVYVSKTPMNKDPLSTGFLGSRLKGVAHLLVQENKTTNNRIRNACRSNNEYHGCVGVYLPNGRHRRFLYRDYKGSDAVMLDNVLHAVLDYANVQQIPELYTWHGVNNALLIDKYESQKEQRTLADLAREKAETDIQEFMYTFDEDNARLSQQIAELQRTNESLRAENQGLRAKLSNTENVPILYLGEEEEFYQGEIREMILDALDEKLSNLKDRSRRADVLRDIVENNDYQRKKEPRENRIKRMFKDYKSMSSGLRQELKDLGFEITEDGKHYRLTYYGDGRYKTTVAKTGSDWREGKNIAAEIIRSMM